MDESDRRRTEPRPTARGRAPGTGAHRQALARRAALAGLLMIGVAAGHGAPAEAYGFGKIKTDDGHVYYASDERTQDHLLFWNHFVHFQNEDGYQRLSGIDMVEQAPYTWTDTTDVVWFAAGGFDRLTGGDEKCMKTVGVINRKCDRARVRFNESWTRAEPDVDVFFVVCHEMGHTLGFEHMNEGCMFSPGKRNVGGIITQHMVDHIREQYL